MTLFSQKPGRILLPALGLCLAFCHGGFVQCAVAEPPTITISKSETVPIQIGAFTGSDAAAAAKILKNDLALSGRFAIASSPGAFVVTAVSAPGKLEGKVTDAAGRTVLAQTFAGGPREKVHAFADAIVETITGERGIASTKIAFVATRSGRKEIYLADYDGAGVVQLTHDGSISVSPALGPGARKLVYTGYQSGYADIYLIDLASGARNRIIKFPGTNSGAAFAPDGGRLAVTLSKDGNPELYVTSVGGGFPRRLTRTRGVESSPTWSPDGSEIIYSSDDRGTPQLYRIGAGGGRPRPLPTGHAYCTEPNWSPDGTKVAFTVRGGGFQVAILDLAGGGTRIVGPGEDPCWGPDSRHLICASGGDIVLIDTRNGKRTAIISGMGRASEPSWSR